MENRKKIEREQHLMWSIMGGVCNRPKPSKFKTLVIKLFHFDLMQTAWGRNYIGGKFYLMQTGLSMAPFWSECKFTCCQGKALRTEIYF